MPATKTIPARDVRIGDRIVTTGRTGRTQSETVVAVVASADTVSVTVKDRNGWTGKRFAATQQITVR